MIKILDKKIEDMNKNELWLLHWYEEHQELGYIIEYGISNRHYVVYSHLVKQGKNN